METTDGIVGWGEGTLEGHTEAVEGAYQEFRDRFIGSDADNIEDIWQDAYRMGFYRGGPVLMVSPHERYPLSSINDRIIFQVRSFWARYRSLGH